MISFSSIILLAALIIVATFKAGSPGVTGIVIGVELVTPIAELIAVVGATEVKFVPFVVELSPPVVSFIVELFALVGEFIVELFPPVTELVTAFVVELFSPIEAFVVELFSKVGAFVVELLPLVDTFIVELLPPVTELVAGFVVVLFSPIEAFVVELISKFGAFVDDNNVETIVVKPLLGVASVSPEDVSAVIAVEGCSVDPEEV